MNNHTPHVECQQERQECSCPDHLDAKGRTLSTWRPPTSNRSLLVAYHLPTVSAWILDQ